MYLAIRELREHARAVRNSPLRETLTRAYEIRREWRSLRLAAFAKKEKKERFARRLPLRNAR